MSKSVVGKSSDDRGTGNSALVKSRYTWAGERKSDKDGVYYTAVSVERKDATFTLNILDTVQMEAPDDNCPFVGTVLRLYEINNRKSIDVEWFFLKSEMLEIAPKNHKNVAIEDKEVFLAEGEVEIVENVLGSVKNPCFIVYLTPQDSLVPANQRAMAKSRFSQLYFCRYSFNQGKGVVNPISPGWAQNKYLLKNWENIPEPIRVFLQKETGLTCFKNPPPVEPKAHMPELPALVTGGASRSAMSASSKSASKAEPQAPSAAVKRESSGGSAQPQSQVRRRDSSGRAVSEANEPNAAAVADRSRRAGTGRGGSGGGGSVSSGTIRTGESPITLSKDQVLSLDVYDLAQRLMFNDIVFSSSDNQTSSDSDDSATQRRRYMPGVVHTKGRSSAQKRAQYKKDTDYIANKWSSLSEAQWKEYFLRARTLKDKYSPAKPSGAAASAHTVTAATRNSASAPSGTTAARPRAASLGSVASKSLLPAGAVKAEPAASAGASRSAMKPAKAPASASANANANAPARGSDSDSEEDDFKDVSVKEYAAMAPTFKSGAVKDEELSYQLFCYDKEIYGSDSTESETSSDEGAMPNGRPRPPKVKTAQQLAERKKRREEKNFRNWTEISFKKLKNYTRRAQRLRKYHEHVARGGKPLPGAVAAGLSKHASSGTVGGGGSVTEVSDTILQAARAGLGKYEIAMQLLAVDMAARPDSASESEEAGRRGRRAQDKSATRRASVQLMLDLGRVEERFNAIPQRRQNEYMRRAGELQAQYGFPDQAYEFSAGASAKFRSKVSADARTTSNVSQGSANRSTASVPSNSPIPQRQRPSAPAAPPATAPRAAKPRITAATEPKKRSAALSGNASSGDEREPVRQRRRKSADFFLAEDPSLAAPLTRKNFSQSRSRYEEVRLKREVAATGVSAGDHRNSAGDQRRGPSKQQSRAPAEASDNGSSQRESSESGSESEGGEKEKPAKIGWRQLKKMREQARIESYRQRAQKLRATMERKREERTTGPEPVFAQPVHALIPTFASARNNKSNIAAADSESDDGSVSSMGSEEQRAQQDASSRRGRGRPSSVFGPSRRRHSAPESAPLRVSDTVSRKRRGEWTEALTEGVFKRGHSSRKDHSALAHNAENNDDAEVAAMGADFPKRRRGRPRKSETTPWNFGLPISPSAVPARARSSASDLPSMASGSVDSASEAGDNSLVSGEEIDATHGYGTRGSRARQNSYTATEFMHQRSPSTRGRVEARIGENYQVDIPDRLVLEDEAPAASATEAVGATTRRSAQSAASTSAVDTSHPLWAPQSALAEEDSVEQALRVADYLARAEDVVARLKAEKLKKHFQSEAKLQKQGALLLAQQQRFSGGAQAGAAAATPDQAEGKLPVEATDNSIVLLSGEARIVMHQALMESDYDVERALSALPGKLGPHLVLWTAAEQHNLGVAYEKYGMHQKSLYAAVPGKPKSDVWEYCLRLLAAAEELEENTTYTNADGAECIIPATRSAAFPEHANSSSSSSSSSNGSSASSGGNLAGEDAALTSEGSRFIEKLAASVDETSFWQLMLSLSSVIKSGIFTPAQLVVKVHYILSMATYNAALSYAHRSETAASPPVAAAVQETEAVSAGRSSDEGAHQEGEADGAAEESAPMAVESHGGAEVTASITTTAESASSSSGSSSSGGGSSGRATTAPASSLRSPSTTVTPRQTDAAVDVFSDPQDALASFNLFLPVLVAQ